MSKLDDLKTAARAVDMIHCFGVSKAARMLEFCGDLAAADRGLEQVDAALVRVLSEAPRGLVR